MKYSTDRFEGNEAVLQDEQGNIIYVSKALLPNGIREGSVLIYDGCRYIRDEESEKLIKKRMFEKQQALLNRKLKK